jgi:hypothetical protein
MDNANAVTFNRRNTGFNFGVGAVKRTGKPACVFSAEDHDCSGTPDCNSAVTVAQDETRGRFSTAEALVTEREYRRLQVVSWLGAAFVVAFYYVVARSGL